jgi:hypothetical protein
MDAGEKATKDAELAAAKLITDRIVVPNKTAGTLGMGTGGSTTSGTTGGSLLIDLDAATKRMAISSLEVDINLAGTKMRFGVCSGDPTGTITIREVRNVDTSSTGIQTLTGFDPFTVLPGDRIWVYSGSTSPYGTLKRVTTAESGFALGYYSKYIGSNGDSILVADTYDSLAENTTHRLRIRALT